MRLGGPIQAGLGDPRKHLAYVMVDQVGQSLRLRAKPAANYGDAFFAFHVQTAKVLNAYLREGEETTVFAPLPYGEELVAVAVFRLGRLADPGYDAYRVARSFQADEAARVTATFAWPAEVADVKVDGADLTSAWSLSGLVYGRNVAAVPGRPTRGKLDVAITNADSTITVTLSRLGVVVASGSAAYTESTVAVSLAAVNESGLSGSVVVDTTGGAAWSGELVVRWPASMQILRGTSSPPSTVAGTVAFDGQAGATWTEAADLTPQAYYYALRAVSDTGETGTASTPESVTVPGAPGAPAALAYKSGTAAAAVASFTASPTAGATYRAYVADADDGSFDFDTPDATAAAGATEITLPALAYPGVSRVIVRAVAAGVEEQNLNAVEIEFDAAGAYVPKRPNGAYLDEGRLVVTAGRALAAVAVYDPSNQAAAPTGVKLFARDPGGAYDYGAPVATAAVVDAGGLKTAALAYTFGADGWYWLRAVPYNADGLADVADCPESTLYLCDDAPAAPTDGAFRVARG